MFTGVPDTLSVDDARRALGCSRATLYRSNMKFTRGLNGRRRYFADDIRLFLLTRTETP